MKDRSTIRSRTLGAELQHLRMKTNLSAGALADLLECSDSRISRLEMGKRGITATDLAAYLAYCGATRSIRNRLLDLHFNSRSPIWVQPHEDHLPDELTSVLHAESTAATITTYDPHVVPPLLQTGDYARAIFHRSLTPMGNVDRRLQARSRRQDALRQLQPPRFTFYIPEPVLHEPVGTPQVMQDQILRLVHIADKNGCTIRIVPHRLVGNAFEQITGYDHDPVVLVETATANLFLEDLAQTIVYREILTQLAKAALNEEQSRRLLLDLTDTDSSMSPTQPCGPTPEEVDA
jgi:transcriptional regulator with XRE-family HTH domain